MAPARTLSSTTPDLEVPVLVVGGGPAGLLQAYLLHRLRVPCLVIERYENRLAAPKAHALSPRTLEICRQAGLDTREIRQLGTNRNEAFYVNFTTNLSGQQVGRLPYERMDVAVLEDTPEMIHNIPQPVFEQLVAAQLRSDDGVDLLKNTSFVSCRETTDGVLSNIENRITGAKTLIRSRYVIACDGARSKVRQSLGIQCDGVDGYEMMMTIHFSCDLRPILGDRAGMLHWILDPVVSGFIINYDPSGNQVLICNFDTNEHPVNSWDELLCRETLLAAIGRKADFEVLSWRPWVLSRKVAKEYRQGNVFLAGDAAHSFPPTGGLGLNSGLADVHNLAWKIAAVYQGWATDSLLETYKSDRQQVASVNAQQSVKNGEKIFSFLKSLGATVSTVSEARQNLLDTVNDAAQAEMIAAHVEDHREHFDNLGLHIGYVYGNDIVPKHASKFTPEFIYGARLPHAWVHVLQNDVITHKPVDVSYVSELSASEIAARKFSTLDLCAPDSFTLITAQSSDWHDRTNHAKQAVSSKIPLRILTLGVDFEMVQNTASGREWVGKSGLGSGSAILVRPDQHILMNASTRTTVEELVDVLYGYLGLTK